MISLTSWQRINLNLVAKSLQELVYEQVLNPVRLNSAADHYRLEITPSLVYSFSAWRGIWTDLKVDATSIRRNDEPATDAAQFFIDTQSLTGMSDITLANFLEEMHNTLYADLSLDEKNKNLTAAEISDWNGDRLQSVLNGHPKLLLNKGRIGWNIQDLENFGPENEKPLQLTWLALRNTKIRQALHSEMTWDQLLLESFAADELERVQTKLRTEGLNSHEFTLCPVHPWQWNRYLKMQFAAEIAQKDICYLGPAGDFYLPQISLRTFSNLSRPGRLDIKLPLTILNTSSIRGLTGKYITQGPSLSADFAKLCAQDPVLQKVEILQEKAGLFMPHSRFEQIKAAPYRYHEFLGAIWRQSAQQNLSSEDKAILTSSLFYRDSKGKSLLGIYAQKAGVNIETWLHLYFENVVVPLYHLQLRYGIGLVAHGQNIMLRLKNFLPSGVFLKDFQGDLRLTTKSQSLNHELVRLPEHYLIHDLITGHFVTVLRFISETLASADQFPETHFYRILGEVLENYLQQNALSPASALDLRQEKFARVLVNRVRFQIGYADTAERPLPILGDELVNPIFIGMHHKEVSRDSQL